MFKRTLQVELSPELRDELKRLEEEVAALNWLVEEVGRKQQQMIALLQEEVVTTVAEATQSALEEAGIQVFASRAEQEDEVETVVETAPEPKQRRPPRSSPDLKLPGPPARMLEGNEEPTDYAHDRRRNSPFSRVPRHEQVQWLLKVMDDGGWYTGVELASEFAEEQRNFRYLRSAITGRMKEMYDEGQLERRSSQVRGAMFEYRIKP